MKLERNGDEAALLLHYYGELYGPEGGPWNSSLKSKYLEYRITAFFEENFVIGPGAAVCNIGIGAGCWDRYLSFRLNGGRLTSIYLDETICRNLVLGLQNEDNPNPVTVLCSDVMLVKGLDCSFDLVTMIGSTSRESGLHERIVCRAFELLKPGGAFFHQTLDPDEKKDVFLNICKSNHAQLEYYLLDVYYGYQAQYYKAVKN